MEEQHILSLMETVTKDVLGRDKDDALGQTRLRELVAEFGRYDVHLVCVREHVRLVRELFVYVRSSKSGESVCVREQALFMNCS